MNPVGYKFGSGRVKHGRSSAGSASEGGKANVMAFNYDRLAKSGRARC